MSLSDGYPGQRYRQQDEEFGPEVAELLDVVEADLRAAGMANDRDEGLKEASFLDDLGGPEDDVFVDDLPASGFDLSSHVHVAARIGEDAPAVEERRSDKDPRRVTTHMCA